MALTVETTRRAYDATRQPPTDDRIFDAEHEANQRKELIKQFERLRGEVRCVVAGLNEIQKKVLSTRKQIGLFKGWTRDDHRSATAINDRTIHPAGW